MRENREGGREVGSRSLVGWRCRDRIRSFVFFTVRSFQNVRYIRATNGVRNTSFFSNRRSKFIPHCMIQTECCLLTSNNVATLFLDWTGKHGTDKTT